jgi:hypothetical protein
MELFIWKEKSKKRGRGSITYRIKRNSPSQELKKEKELSYA